VVGKDTAAASSYRLPMRDAMRFHRLPICLWPATSTRSSCSTGLSTCQD